MQPLAKLIDNNKNWASGVNEKDPQFFAKLAKQQTPEFLWIGCADSRVPANQIIGVDPGEVFVHRNVANVVVHTDFNCLSVIEYAVAVLKVKHVIVCGHYGCGGVKAASESRHLGLIDNWLRHIRDVRQKHEETLDEIDNEVDRVNRLCELNVVEQVSNVCSTSVVQAAWDRGQELVVHGWIYGIQDGLLRDLGVSISRNADLAAAYRLATDPDVTTA